MRDLAAVLTAEAIVILAILINIIVISQRGF